MLVSQTASILAPVLTITALLTQLLAVNSTAPILQVMTPRDCLPNLMKLLQQTHFRFFVEPLADGAPHSQAHSSTWAPTGVTMT